MRPVALAACLAFVLWLFAKDRRLRPMPGGGAWLALAWIAIISSRPVSLWLGAGVPIETLDDYLEGSPTDRNVFAVLIVLGIITLLRRRLDWGRILRENAWLWAFFLYSFASVFWSDYFGASLKRLVKDLGNVVVVLILVTERDPVGAVRAVFLRCCYLAIPLSVVFIRYFPEYGRVFNHWTGEPVFCGVTTEKNALGILMYLCGIFLVWELLELRKKEAAPGAGADRAALLALLAMMGWTLAVARSSTSMLCLVIGVLILFLARRPAESALVRHLGAATAVALALFLFLQFNPGARGAVVGMMGRDVTLTGRTDLWARLLEEPVNPLLGAGYQSFWQSPGAEGIGQQYYFIPNQAHNGYLETYLQVGSVGLVLLLATLVTAGRRLRYAMAGGSSYATLLYALLVVGLVHNWTEATFNKLVLSWVVIILAVVGVGPRPAGAGGGPDASGDAGEERGAA